MSQSPPRSPQTLHDSLDVLSCGWRSRPVAVRAPPSSGVALELPGDVARILFTLALLMTVMLLMSLRVSAQDAGESGLARPESALSLTPAGAGDSLTINGTLVELISPSQMEPAVGGVLDAFRLASRSADTYPQQAIQFDELPRPEWVAFLESHGIAVIGSASPNAYVVMLSPGADDAYLSFTQLPFVTWHGPVEPFAKIDTRLYRDLLNGDAGLVADVFLSSEADWQGWTQRGAVTLDGPAVDMLGYVECVRVRAALPTPLLTELAADPDLYHLAAPGGSAANHSAAGGSLAQIIPIQLKAPWTPGSYWIPQSYDDHLGNLMPSKSWDEARRAVDLYFAVPQLQGACDWDDSNTPPVIGKTAKKTKYWDILAMHTGTVAVYPSTSCGDDIYVEVSSLPTDPYGAYKTRYIHIENLDPKAKGTIGWGARLGSIDDLTPPSPCAHHVHMMLEVFRAGNPIPLPLDDSSADGNQVLIDGDVFFPMYALGPCFASPGTADQGLVYRFKTMPRGSGVPAIASVSPNPVPGVNGLQTLTIFGSNFVSGCTVTLKDMTNGGTYPGKPTTLVSSGQVAISANFTTASATWSVQVVNPNGLASNAFTFPVSSQPPATAELMANGLFNDALTGWQRSGDFWWFTFEGKSKSPPGYVAGGVDSAGVSKNNALGELWQDVSIPATASKVTVSFWYSITTSETTVVTAYDVLNVTLKSQSGTYLGTVATLSNLKATTGYVKLATDMTWAKGQAVRLDFLVTSDGSLPTTFRIDDVSILAE